MSTDGEEFAQRYEALVGSEEHRLAMTLRRFSVSVTVLDRNYQMLSRYILWLCQSVGADVLMASRNRDKFENALIELSRLLHNYVASVMSLVDHSRKLYKSVFLNRGPMSDYSAMVSATFANDPLSQFVQGLRGYCLHFRSPPIGMQVEVSPDRGETKTMELDSVALLEYDSWNAQARFYIESVGTDIGIFEVLAAYHAKVLAFQRWFSRRQEEVFAEAFARYAQEAQEISGLQLLLELRAVVQGKAGHANIDTVFSHILNDAEIVSIESSPREKQHGHAVACLSRHVAVSTEIQQLLRVALPLLAKARE